MLRTCCSVVDAPTTLENIFMHANILDMAFMSDTNDPIRMQIRWSLWRLDNMYVMKVNKLADMVVKMPNKDFTDGTQGKGDNNNMNNNKKALP